MVEQFFQRVVIPVANRDDAAATTAALLPHVENTDSTVIAVHVIEKAGGAPDKASVAQLEERAEDIFSIVTDGFADTGVSPSTRLLYGTDIAASIINAAHESDASAIVFTPRGGSRWRKLLTGDVSHKLIENSDIPILVLPDEEVNDA
jgi:nucleotide-binding universal stress UspA family protein